MNDLRQSGFKISEMLSKHTEIKVKPPILEQNYSQTKTGSCTVQLGNSILIIETINRFSCSEEESFEYVNLLKKLEPAKASFSSIIEEKEALASSEVGILVRGGDLGKLGPGPRAKSDASLI